MFAKASLKNILIVPLVIQITAIVSVISYFSYQNSRRTIEELAVKLNEQTTDHIKKHIINYLDNSHRIHNSLVANIESGIIDLNDYDRIQNIFWHQTKHLDSLSFIYFGNRNGDFIGVKKQEDGQYFAYIRDTSTIPNRNAYPLDRLGNRSDTAIESREYDPRQRSWYLQAQKTRTQTWSPVYSFASSNSKVLGISPITPIYNKLSQFQGVLANDLSLEEISDFLRNLEVTPNAKIFIVERNGEIIATSTAESPFKLDLEKQERLEIIESKDIVMKQTAQYLIEEYGNFEAIEDNRSLSFQLNDGQQEYLQVKSLQDKGLDWLIVVAIPERDLTSRINDNTRNTIILSVFALTIAITLVYITSQKTTKPILKLNRAAKELARGEWDKTIEIEGTKEVKELSFSFNLMAIQLKESFATLEQRVAERTTQFKEAKEAAESANRAKDRFLANITHELRTPLNSILGYAKIMQRDLAKTERKNSDPDSENHLRTIQQSGSHLLTLINDILDFSKTLAGKIELRPCQFHLPSFLEGVASIVAMLAKEKGLQFNCQYNNLPEGIEADPTRLRQVLINLLSNAIKFTPEGEITLKVTQISSSTSATGRVENLLRFEVSDTGVGITSEGLKKIFQPFEQLGDIKSRTDGMGLGLSISKQLVELMGGKLEVKTEFTQGSTFWFDLILPGAKLNDDLLLIAASQTNEILGYKGKIRKILVVDDIQENREFLIELLQPIGFFVMSANNGQQMLEIACTLKPDLILLDLNMPVKNGYQSAKESRKIPEIQNIPIVILSANNIAPEMQKDLQYQDYLSKPIQIDRLFACLQKYLHLEWIYEAEVGS